MEPTIRLYLDNRTTEDRDDRRIVADDGTISRFMRWCIDNEIYAFSGGEYASGYLIGYYPAAHTEAITAYLTRDGLLPQQPKDQSSN